jgi:hypothetical protein
MALECPARAKGTLCCPPLTTTLTKHFLRCLEVLCSSRAGQCSLVVIRACIIG